VYTFNAFWGFAGSARPEPFPPSWSEASAVMGSGPGKVLALPGDQYLPFGWTQERPVANPMTSFFRRDVLIDGSLHLDGLESQTNDGESEYLLNKTVCRLKDIHDLFLGTGVNPKAYALMEQERLAHILTAKPLDRRVFVEEAAGITRYKLQRAETLTKLEATRQNLLRVRDVMDEVKRQLSSLERQAKKAQQHKALQAERRAIEVALLAAEHATLAGEEERLGVEEAAERSRVETGQTRVAALGAGLELARADVMAAEQRAAESRHTLQRAELELEGCVGRAEQLRLTERDLGAEVDRLREEAEALSLRLKTLAEE
jgi:chromosome segregation protein